MNVAESVRQRVEQALELCRPFLRKDGGDAELVRVSDDGIAEVRFQGTCVTCPLSPLTLRAGLERAILNAAPEIRRVESVK